MNYKKAAEGALAGYLSNETEIGAVMSEAVWELYFDSLNNREGGRRRKNKTARRWRTSTIVEWQRTKERKL